MAFQHFQHLISHHPSAQQLNHAQSSVLWPAEQGLVGPAVAQCPETLHLFTAAAPLKVSCASGDLPAEDLQDLGLKMFYFRKSSSGSCHRNS